jgi:hypothetical protein
VDDEERCDDGRPRRTADGEQEQDDAQDLPEQAAVRSATANGDGAGGSGGGRQGRRSHERAP